MKKRTLRLGLAIVLIGLLVVSIVVIYMFNKPHLDVASLKPDFSLSAAQLYKEFKTDENNANKKYLGGANGKIVQVSGVISDIITGEHGLITFTVKDESIGEGGVSCSIDSTNLNKAGKVKIGDTVVIKGQCTGYIELTNEVDLNKCFIIE